MLVITIMNTRGALKNLIICVSTIWGWEIKILKN